jgi:hypothetical protein
VTTPDARKAVDEPRGLLDPIRYVLLDSELKAAGIAINSELRELLPRALHAWPCSLCQITARRLTADQMAYGPRRIVRGRRTVQLGGQARVSPEASLDERHRVHRSRSRAGRVASKWFGSGTRS